MCWTPICNELQHLATVAIGRKSPVHPKLRVTTTQSDVRPMTLVNNRTAEHSPLPIPIDPHYSPQFYAELWGMSASTVIRWFQDLAGVLKLSKPSKNGRRVRVELRIPFSLAMRVYSERTRPGLE
jgi:hypothetical protein